MPAESRRDAPVTNASGLGRERRTDDLDGIAPAQEGVFGNQHVRAATRPTHRAPEPATLGPDPQAHLALDALAPRAQSRPATGTAEPTASQICLDGSPVDTYDEHSGAPASSGRAPSRSVERSFCEGALARSRNASPSPSAPGPPNRQPRTRPHRQRRRQRDHRTMLTFGGGNRPADAHPTRRSTGVSARG